MFFADDDLLRYSRHILLPDVDVPGQEKLFSAKILIIGVGGLGSPVALYLAASGVGDITIADPDKVELNNLQRQIAYDEQDLGDCKVSACYHKMNRINSQIQIHAISAEVAAADVVVDCTDNLTTRFEINQACVTNKKWLVSAAAIRWEGQISSYHCGFEESPCYYCFYGGRKESADKNLRQNCSNSGVLSPVVGVLGSMQAIEVIKIIINKGDLLLGRVLLFDALSMQWESMQLPKNPGCFVCGH